MEIKTTAKLMKKEGFVHTFQLGDKKLPLQLSDRVYHFLKDKKMTLVESATYNISYDDESNLVMYITSIDENKAVKTLPKYSESEKKKFWEEKDDSICAQACLKAAAQVSKNEEELFSIAKKAFNWIKNKDYLK